MFTKFIAAPISRCSRLYIESFERPKRERILKILDFCTEFNQGAVRGCHGLLEGSINNIFYSFQQ